MFPQIGDKARVNDLPVIDPEWRNAEVVVVAMDMRRDSHGTADTKRSRIMVANAAGQKRDLPIDHLSPR